MYLRILSRKWWIVLLTFLITYGATLAFTYTQAPTYHSRATFVVKLNASFSNDRDLASAVDVLSRRTEIATTYTIVANSRMIRRAAVTALSLSAPQRANVSVSSDLLPGTNVVEIVGESNDPILARDFTDAVGAQTVSYVGDLYETYRLEPLDTANLSEIPVAPNKPLNLTLGALLGLILGVSFALLAAYLQAPVDVTQPLPQPEPGTVKGSRPLSEPRDLASI
jgi:uncharacterized protein involved in exopolysaccharide biosynthesis